MSYRDHHICTATAEEHLDVLSFALGIGASAEVMGHVI